MTFDNTNYKQCPCHDCSVQDVPEGDSYDCGCDGGPLLEHCSELCPSLNKCRAVRDVSTYLEMYGNKCPRCKSDTGLKWPKGDQPYCEDCGWPHEDFDAE